MKNVAAIGMPTGLNLVPEWYVMGKDCYWKNNSPVNEKHWGLFKRLQDHHTRLQMLFNKPMAFSLDFITETFNPVLHMVTQMVLRDPIFAFISFVKNLDDEGLTLDWDNEKQYFVLGYNHLYKNR